VEFCPHEVFEEKDGKPSVKNPENCVEFCRGCQRGACSNGAISFAGDRKRTREVV
jgi:NAD-dependent dihydropyrimidine dehydrogenase PreA subunit